MRSILRRGLTTAALMVSAGFAGFATFQMATPPGVSAQMTIGSAIAALLGGIVLSAASAICLRRRPTRLEIVRWFFIPTSMTVSLAGILPVIRGFRFQADAEMSKASVLSLFADVTASLTEQSVSLVWAMLSFAGLVLLLSRNAREGMPKEEKSTRSGAVLIAIGVVSAFNLYFIRFDSLGWYYDLATCGRGISSGMSMTYQLFFVTLLLLALLPLAIGRSGVFAKSPSDTRRIQAERAGGLMGLAFAGFCISAGLLITVNMARGLVIIVQQERCAPEIPSSAFQLTNAMWTALFSPLFLVILGILVGFGLVIRARGSLVFLKLPVAVVMAAFAATAALRGIADDKASGRINLEQNNCVLAHQLVNLSKRDVVYHSHLYRTPVCDIRPHEDLVLPNALQAEEMKDMLVVEVRKRSIVVGYNKAVDLRSREVDETFLSGPRKFLIKPLLDALEERSLHLRAISQRTGGGLFGGELMLVIDRNTPMALVQQTIFTAREAGFHQHYAVVDAFDDNPLCRRIGLIKMPPLEHLFDESVNGKTFGEMLNDWAARH